MHLKKLHIFFLTRKEPNRLLIVKKRDVFKKVLPKLPLTVSQNSKDIIHSLLQRLTSSRKDHMDKLPSSRRGISAIEPGNFFSCLYFISKKIILFWKLHIFMAFVKCIRLCILHSFFVGNKTQANILLLGLLNRFKKKLTNQLPGRMLSLSLVTITWCGS